jgi:protocatechuate 3,4-dioxygenase beta subunit
MTTDSTRRDFLTRTAVAASGFGLSTFAAVGAEQGTHAEQDLPPTPACHDGDEPTVAETEGPFFKPKSPERSDLREKGMPGEPVWLIGFVLTRKCRPVGKALVELWHADDSGEYDNKGFRLRGHQFTAPDGRYAFRTIRPGPYVPRTRHYHVKVQAPGRPVLTTQFYFPDEPGNAKDGLYRPELTMRVAHAEDGFQAHFDIVLDLG